MVDLARNAHEPPRRLPLSTQYPPGRLSSATIARERSCHPWTMINWSARAVRPLACRRVRGPPCDTFLAPVVASRRYSQQVTFIGAEFRRYLWIRTLAP